jgi:hypothetical protein
MEEHTQIEAQRRVQVALAARTMRRSMPRLTRVGGWVEEVYTVTPDRLRKGRQLLCIRRPQSRLYSVRSLV